ncbi:metallophosphoesterase [Halobellus sp. GM3]|uniref:metallophosphoesterase n=1 Tax=Halobellus sp. GM3 TaxID=3458410 RepID=UPI00403DF10E
MPLSFAAEVAAQHRRVDLSEWEDVYVIGDVHGCDATLERLIEAVGVTDDDLLLFVGDLVRKGPASAAVIERVRGADNMLAVRGNNEEKLLRGEKSLPGLDRSALTWLRSLPVAISWDGGLVVHGGVDPSQPLSEHTVDDFQTMRSPASGDGYDGPFWYEAYEAPPRVFFGHTVLENPIVTESAVGLDTGCVYGGSLTAYRLGDGAVHSVPARREGVDRPAAKVVSTTVGCDAGR